MIRPIDANKIQVAQNLPVFAGQKQPASLPAEGAQKIADVSAQPAVNLQALKALYFAGASKSPVGELLAASRAKSLANYQTSKEVMSFREFLDLVYEEPKRYIPTASGFARQALQSYGTRDVDVLGEKRKHHQYADAPWLSRLLKQPIGVVGQEHVFEEIEEILESFGRHGQPNRMIALFGPKGCAKTVIIKTLMEAIEQYNKENKRYTYSWKFGEPGVIPPFFIGGTKEERDAYLARSTSSNPASGDGLLLPSQANNHPLFLLPLEVREQLLKKLIAEGKLSETDNFEYFLKGDLDDNSKIIFEKLRKHYNGDLDKVYQHIQVETWQMSTQNGRGLTIIPPSKTRDAFLQQVTQDIDWSKLPSFLHHAGLKNLIGYLSQANGGILNYDDMGREMDPTRYVYLLNTAETGEAFIGDDRASGVKQQLDMLIFSSLNPDSLAALTKDRQWEAIKDRVVIIPVGHLRRFRVEQQVFEPYVANEVAAGRQVGPDFLEPLTLFLTMTRLYPVNPNNDDYKRLATQYSTLGERGFLEAVGKLDPLRKALLYQGDDLNSFEYGKNQKFSRREQKILRQALPLIKNEYNYGVGTARIFSYEGGHGLSVREGQNYIQEIIDSVPKDEPLTFLNVFQVLARKMSTEMPYFRELCNISDADERLRVISKKYTYEARAEKGTKETFKAPFMSPPELLALAEDHMRRKVQLEIKLALDLYRDPQQNYERLNKYLAHVEAKVLDDVVKDTELRYPGKSDHYPSEKLMRELEAMLRPDLFRKNDAGFIRDSKGVIEAYSEADVEAFRLSVAGRLGSFKNENTRQENVEEVFEDELKKLIAADDSESSIEVKTLVDDLLDFILNPKFLESQPGRKRDKQQLSNALDKLKTLYPEKSIPSMLDWAFSTKFIAKGEYTVRRMSRDKH